MLPIGRKINNRASLKRQGFTLIELVLTVALIAVGMVFVLGALNQCALAHANAEKEIVANYALTNIITKFDVCKRQSSKEICLNLISAEYEDFNLTRIVSPVAADFGSENSLIQDNFYQEEFRLSWKLGRRNRHISFVRYVQSKKR